jgi:sterol carrier protein 2
MERVVVAGVGMTPFTSPSKAENYDVMGEVAVRAALTDACVSYDQIGQAFAAYVYGDSTSGQRVLYRVGMTGIPVVNVNNNCSSGSSALWLARQAVASGMAECVLAVGFEQMQRGALRDVWTDRPSPLSNFNGVVEDRFGPSGVPMAIELFGGAGADYIERFGAAPETFAKISVKARQHAAMNSRAVFRDAVTVEQVMASPTLYKFLTRLQACPPTSGAAAAVLCSESFAEANGLDARVRILGQAMATDTPGSFDPDNLAHVVGYGISEQAAAMAYEESGVDPHDVDVVELHDCFTVNEVLSYEALKLAPIGGAERFIEAGDNTYGGRVVVNPSGGLLSKGHPLGATGLAQCAELVWQLRGTADGGRQVAKARLGLQHNVGLGGAAVVSVYGTVDR